MIDYYVGLRACSSLHFNTSTKSPREEHLVDRGNKEMRTGEAPAVKFP